MKNMNKDSFKISTKKPFYLSDEQIKNIVSRSYQYVALYNIINKYALDRNSSTPTYHWNKVTTHTKLLDHTEQSIARPNNDTLYSVAMLDLRGEPIILEIPAIDSAYVSLQTSAYDHYITIPLTVRRGDYQTPKKILFYTARTPYFDRNIAGIDQYIEMTGDFVIAFHRVMPHANEPERFELIKQQMMGIQLKTLSEYVGNTSPRYQEVLFPAIGKTDSDVFGSNLLEVMQFVFNHTTFNPNQYPLDKALLDAYAPLSVIPGQTWNPTEVAQIDNVRFKQIALQVQQEQLALARNQQFTASILPNLFREKAHPGISLDTMLFQSVFGPIGLPSDEAIYPPINTQGGEPMNALNDYTVSMTQSTLALANAFWSMTLYDTQNGFFIPNSEKKYSVGLNSGYKLNPAAGIDIYIAEKQPDGVPKENWLPINRQDQNLDLVLRIYDPKTEDMKTWKAPNVEKITATEGHHLTEASDNVTVN